MPLDAWLLLIVSVGLGLGLELASYRAFRARGAVSDSAGVGTVSEVRKGSTGSDADVDVGDVG